MKPELRKRFHKVVLEFAIYAKESIPKKIANARTVMECFPKDIRNAPLSYLLNVAMKGILESLLNDLDEAAELLDKVLNDFGEAGGLKKTSEIRDVLRMRNKLFAHRMEVSAATDKHRMWYTEKYGSYAKAFAVIETASEQLGSVARGVSGHPEFQKVQGKMSEHPLLKKQDIENLLNVLKRAEIY